MKKLIAILFLAILPVMSFSQGTRTETLTEAEQLVVLQERLKAKQDATPSLQKGTEYASEFAEACKSFLATFDEGTEITIERLNQFMATDAGKVTVFFVGWKVLGQDAMSIATGVGQTLLGIVLLVPYGLWIRYVYRFFVTGKNVCVVKEAGLFGKRTYEWQGAKATQLGDEAYVGWSVVSTVATIIFTIVLGILIF